MSSPLRRPSRREQQAEDTRRLVVSAARKLFAAKGYGATSIAEIADEAGVAVPTIYASVGPKPRLVALLNDLIDEESDVRALAAAIAAATAPSDILGLAVRLTRQLNERCGDILAVLLSAASSEPDVAAVVEDGLRRHREGTRRCAGRIAEVGGLKHGVTVESAAASIALMTAPASYLLLTKGYGWTFDRCESWIASSLTQLLLV